MTRWRLAAAALLGLLVAAPLGFLFAELVQHYSSLTAGDELARQATLIRNTLLLVGGTLALALPAGVAAAVLFYRTDLPFSGFFRFLTFLTLFIPLPVLTAAWQAALGSGGLWGALWPDAPGRPWASGLWPAVWVHASAALPWVVLIVGQGLRWVERELEEDALLAAGPWRVLGSVTLPRCRAAIGAAALFVALQTSSEITVAALMQVQTFAEEVLNEFRFGGETAAARATLSALPGIAALALLVLWLLPRLDRALPPLDRFSPTPRPIPLGRWRLPCLLLVTAALLVLAGVPLASLVWKAGLHGSPLSWSADYSLRSVAVAARQYDLLLRSGLVALVAAGLVAGTALVLCWLALEARGFRMIALGLAAVLWATPGPLVGIGLKGTILAIVDWSPDGPLAQGLYYRPSPLPYLWANLLRYLPCALAMLWPVVRMLPRELRDSASVDGAAPRQELALVVWPLTRRAVAWVVLVVAALALGEVGAVVERVETPGWVTFAQVLFDRLHYGTLTDVPGLCLLLVLTVAGAGLLAGCVRMLLRSLNESK